MEFKDEFSIKSQCLLWITLRQKKGEKKFQMKDNFRGDENDLALPDSRRRSLILRFRRNIGNIKHHKVASINKR